VEHDVSAVLERPLDRGRRERVVDDDQRPRPALGLALRHGPRDGGDVDDLEERVRRRFEPDEAGALSQRLPQRVGLRVEVHVARLHARRAMHPLEVAVRAAVDVVADHDLLARDRQLRNRGGRS
jgi:hypothetical protein